MLYSKEGTNFPHWGSPTSHGNAGPSGVPLVFCIFEMATIFSSDPVTIICTFVVRTGLHQAPFNNHLEVSTGTKYSSPSYNRWVANITLYKCSSIFISFLLLSRDNSICWFWFIKLGPAYVCERFPPQTGPRLFLRKNQRVREINGGSLLKDTTCTFW